MQILSFYIHIFILALLNFFLNLLIECLTGGNVVRESTNEQCKSDKIKNVVLFGSSHMQRV